MNEVAPALAQRWKGEVRPACLSGRLGSERWFLTQTQLSNTAGRTASLLLSLRLKSSKIIIIPLALPARGSASPKSHRSWPRGSRGEGVSGGRQKGGPPGFS